MTNANINLTQTELALILGALNEHMENMEWDEKEMTPDEVDDALDSYTKYRTLYNQLLEAYDNNVAWEGLFGHDIRSRA